VIHLRYNTLFYFARCVTNLLCYQYSPTPYVVQLAAKFRNSGQTCVCANRILVQEGIFIICMILMLLGPCFFCQKVVHCTYRYL
jgi:hypothetical protein